MKTTVYNLIFYYLFLGQSIVFAAIPTIQHWETSQGTRVYFIETHELPILDIQMVFNAGSVRDYEYNKSGLAKLTNALLVEGSGEFSADEIAQKMDYFGARYSVSVDQDSATLSLRSVTKPALLQSVLALLETLVSSPRFEEQAFQRVQQQMLRKLEYNQQSPSAIAKEIFYQVLYPNHPYANLPDGNPVDVNAITLTDVNDFYEQFYVAKNAIISLVGDITRAQAEEISKQLTKRLPTGDAATPLPKPEYLEEQQIFKINYPSTQTHILIGQLGMSRHDPNYFPLYIGNHILGGGGLVSRLYQTIREERGLAYSVYSQLIPKQTLGPFMVVLQTKNQQAQLAEQLVENALKKFIHQGITAEELEKAKKNITGGFPLKIASNSDMVSYLSMIGFYQMPLDHLEKFNQKIQAVSMEAIQKAFRQRFDLDKMVTVMVGDIAMIEEYSTPTTVQ